MRYIFILSGVVCLSFMLLPACAPQAEEQVEPVAEEAPSTEADVKAIKSVSQQNLTAMNAGDVDAMVSLHADDYIWYPQDEPAVVGKEATRERLQSGFEKFEFDHSWSSEEIVVFGDWAFNRGTFTGTNTPKDGGEPFQVNGKYISILKRQADGSWKFARFIWNLDNPPPEEPTT